MSECILYTQPDDLIVILDPKSHTTDRRETPDETLARIIHTVVPKHAVKVLVVDSRNLPTDYTFHGAWKLDGAHITTDMPKARDIHRRRLRAARGPMLAMLDVEYQRADEGEDMGKKREIAARKQKLRDVTSHPDIEAAQTPEELSRVWPFDDAAPQQLPEAPMLIQRKPEHDWSMSDLLARAANEPAVGLVDAPPQETPALPAPEIMTVPSPLPPPQDDTGRRRAAKAHIRRIAAAFAFEANTEALRYEQALLAHNGNIAAIQDLEMEAMAAGVSVQKLAEKIIDGRRLHSRRMLRVKTVHDDALKALDAAQGDAIRMIEREAVAQMEGEPNASVDA
jgi:hypothetical protein